MNRRQFICVAVGAGLIASWRAALAVSVGTKMTVYKDPNCGCCHAWADAMAKAGFKIEIIDNADLASVKKRLGVPDTVQGCHTATVGNYFIEGHVPLNAVEELMTNPRDIAGLAVAGMPSGSLGMGNDPNATYDVYEVSQDGRVSIMMNVRPKT